MSSIDRVTFCLGKKEFSMMENQIDLYTGIHKGQRRRFFAISMEAGTVDYADQNAFDRLQEELESFKEEMWRHAASEEKFIHPLLSMRVAGGSRRLDEDHHIMHQQFEDLLANFKEIKGESSDFEKKPDIV